MRYEILGLLTHQMGRIDAMWDEPFAVQRDRRYSRMLRLARTAMECELPLILDGTYERTAEREALGGVARAHGYKIAYIYVYASDVEVVLARFRHRADAAFGPDHRANDPAIYFDSLARFERFTPEEVQSYDAYGELDSVTKQLTSSRAVESNLSDIFAAVQQVYAETQW
jgi:predicted kinase